MGRGLLGDNGEIGVNEVLPQRGSSQGKRVIGGAPLGEKGGNGFHKENGGGD